MYIIVVYFLWKQIFQNADSMHDMTFNQVFLYLTLAGSMVIMFQTFTDWSISRQIQDGTITLKLTKPLDFQWQTFFESLGVVSYNMLIITLPSMILIFIVFHTTIPMSWNLLFFPISLIGSYLLSFFFDYIVGLVSFYTQSIWGISMAKDVITSVLSGAVVPLAFFPPAIAQVLGWLPFQAIYNTPLQIITSPSLTVPDYLRMIGVQFIWVGVFLVITRFLYQRVIAVLTVNGG